MMMMGTIKILLKILLPLLPLFPSLHIRVSLTGWCGDEPQERSYHTPIHAIFSKPVLMVPNVYEEFILRTDV